MSLTSQLRNEIAFRRSFDDSLLSIAKEAGVPYASLHKFANETEGADLPLKQADKLWAFFFGHASKRDRLQKLVCQLIVEQTPPEHRNNRTALRLAETLVDPILKLVEKATAIEVRKMKDAKKQSTK